MAAVAECAWDPVHSGAAKLAIVVADAIARSALGLDRPGDQVVERRAVAVLRDLSYTIGQGFRFAEPMTAYGVTQLLRPAGRPLRVAASFPERSGGRVLNQELGVPWARTQASRGPSGRHGRVADP